MSRQFDRFMVDIKASSNAKVKRLKRAGKEVRWAWFHGVLPIAATAPMRGSFCVGSTSADEHDVAAMADVTPAEARKALNVARELGMLDRDEHGVEWIHDFEVYNPEPKGDTTAAERARRYRERQRARRNASRDATCDGRDANGAITPPEVEEEEEDHPPAPASGGAIVPAAPPAKPIGRRQRDQRVYAERRRAWFEAGFIAATDDDLALWESAQGELRNTVDDVARATWLDTLSLVGRLHGSVAFTAPVETRSWIVERFAAVISRALHGQPFEVLTDDEYRDLTTTQEAAA